jgi:hypothetical protein
MFEDFSKRNMDCTVLTDAKEEFKGSLDCVASVNDSNIKEAQEIFLQYF